jgi:hypothetical protein
MGEPMYSPRLNDIEILFGNDGKIPYEIQSLSLVIKLFYPCGFSSTFFFPQWAQFLRLLRLGDF